MTLSRQAGGSWLIMLAGVLLLTSTPVQASVVLSVIGLVLWVSVQRQAADGLSIIFLLVLVIAFLLPLPLPSTIPLPLRLALVVGGWTVIASLASAGLIWRNRQKNVGQATQDNHHRHANNDSGKGE